MSNPQIDFQRIRAIACGNWKQILTDAGLHQAYLTGRHTPCPFCGGKDRFRFIDSGKLGTWICSQCQPENGDGFQLLARVLDCDIKGAFLYVARAFRLITPSPSESPRKAFIPCKAANDTTTAEQRHQQAKKAAEKAQGIWQQGHPITSGSPVGLYLKSRGLMLDAYPDSLRFHTSLDYWQVGADGKPEKLGNYPAMIARIENPAGELVGLHITYLTPHGRKADVPKPKKITHGTDLQNAAIRLFHANSTLGIAEGIETALAAYLMAQMPVWAGISAWGMENIVLPYVVKEVVIFADHDKAGAHAANMLAMRLMTKGLTVRILTPTEQGQDWNDHLQQLQGRAA
ncbi:toprim domain-containing protein [Leeia sp. TBRC 13508]|uniref:Toprim domain-containing protein n=1 Tax=Leeia speluncae TaxID=2884804 RepID=A0ABS8D469_9NEIS|nr:toprim domain-containing protein [Leeia speluncae]MCB6182974.1 toprim domain-containing protein [Leeia speluncae]